MTTLYVSSETAAMAKGIIKKYAHREQKLLDQIETLRNALLESDHALFMKGVTMDDPIRKMASKAMNTCRGEASLNE